MGSESRVSVGFQILCMDKMWLLIVLAVMDSFDGHVIAFMDHKYTNTWAVQINADVDEATRMAEKYGFTYKMKISANYYLFEHKSLPKTCSKPSSLVEDGLIQEPLITWFAQQVKQRKVLYDHHVPISFNDPRWSDQVWYLNSPDGKGMNIDQVWQQGITGKGIVVAVVDDGLEQSHPDLRDNYDPAASLDLVDLDDTPNPVGNNSGHGNRCGGVIAASANNSECGVGVAFNANVGGIRLFEDDDDDTTDAMEALAFEHNRQHIDIYSCSWGPEDLGWTMGGPGKLANEQLQEGAKTGRQGKGSIFVFAAGNGGWNYDNCAYNGYANSVFTIAISGISRNGSIPGYAERCSAVMACTYSQDNVRGFDAIITSNLNGTCTSTFSQTSAATAMASGIIALTLEANPSLTWRDVQHLIAYSSNSDVPRSGDWMENAAGMWVSSYVGFGLMDAAVMVNYSRAWHTVPDQVKCEVAKPTGYRFFRQHLEVNVTISDDNCGQESSIRYLEHVVVILEANFARRGYLEAFLTSPSGTTSQILPYRANDVVASNFNDWPILSLQFWGEDPQGTWRLRLQSRYPHHGFSGHLWKWTLALYGTATDPLQHNPHVPKSVRNRATPRAVTDDFTAAPVDPAAGHQKGMTETAIAVISSVVFLVLVVICGIVLFKAGVISRERKRITNTKLTTEINLSEQTAPLRDGDSVWIESSL